MGLSQFFIERPVFAWVIAIVIALMGALAINILPITQYPTIAPPAVTVVATYPGASAETVQNSVTQVIEQQLTGVDNLLYFSSSSSSNGQVSITATFAPGTNPDIAQVQVQNKVQQALPVLPQEVQQQGVVVLKSQSSFLLVVALYDDSGRYTNIDISDFIASKLQDPLSRISGVGQAQVFGSPYAMRIWLDPYKLNSYRPDAGGCAAGDPGAERPGVGRRARRAAGDQGPAARRDGDRAIAAGDAGAVPRHRAENQPGRSGRAAQATWRASNSARKATPSSAA